MAGDKMKKACANRSCGLHFIEVEVDESVEQCIVCTGAVLTRGERLIGVSIKDVLKETRG